MLGPASSTFRQHIYMGVILYAISRSYIQNRDLNNSASQACGTGEGPNICVELIYVVSDLLEFVSDKEVSSIVDLPSERCINISIQDADSCFKKIYEYSLMLRKKVYGLKYGLTRKFVMYNRLY